MRDLIGPTSCATGAHRRESAIAESLDAAVALLSHTYWVNVHGEAMSHGGTPDRLGCSAGRSLAIEIKQPDKLPTSRQLVELRRWQAAGALVGWVTSVDDLESLLARRDDRGWINPLTGPGDPTVGDTHAGSVAAPLAGGP